MSECVLVTGAAGFMGSHFVDRLLADGHEVVGVDNLQAGVRENVPPRERFRFLQADVRERGWWGDLAGLRVRRIIHLAANASVPHSFADPGYDLTTNIQGTLNLLELARQHDACFVLVSTAAVYGAIAYLPIDERHPREPVSHYGTSKLAAEGYVRLYRTQFGVDTRVVRFFNSFGPRQPRYIVFDYLRKAFEPGDTFEVLGDGTQRRTQLFATDAVEATLLVAEHGDGEPYNIGSEQEFSVLELAAKVLAITGREHKRIVTTGASWPGDIRVLVPDISRVKALGFRPKVSLDEGLQQTLAWWQRTRPAT